jgi:hypothetical protein
LWLADSLFQRVDSNPRQNDEIKNLGEPSGQKVRSQASLRQSFVLKPKRPERQQQDGCPEKKETACPKPKRKPLCEIPETGSHRLTDLIAWGTIKRREVRENSV